MTLSFGVRAEVVVPKMRRAVARADNIRPYGCEDVSYEHYSVVPWMSSGRHIDVSHRRRTTNTPNKVGAKVG